MELKIFPYGPLSSNMYLFNTDSGVFLIDPSVDPERLNESDFPEKIDYILITHGHFDHINAVDEWSYLYPQARIYISEDDMEALTDPVANGSAQFVCSCNYSSKADIIESLKLDGLTIIKTPGHSRGSVCLLFEEGGTKVMFTGDTLFAGSCGRTDLHGGNDAQMCASLKLLSEMDPDIRVYPGHGPSSTIENERKINPFFNL